MAITAKAAKKVACPYCHAEPGKPCKAGNENVLRLLVHPSRKAAAAKK